MPTRRQNDTPDSGPIWTLITNHGAALLYIARHPDAMVREIADAIGVTERAAARILHDLREAGYLKARRIWRLNVYELDPSQQLRHQAGKDHAVGELLTGLVPDIAKLPDASRAAARNLREATGN